MIRISPKIAFTAILMISAPIMALAQNSVTYSIGQLNWGSDVKLSGARQTTALYIPISPLNQITKATVHLNLSHSPLLKDSSNLTLEVNGTPVSTLKLTEANAQAGTWDVVIPAHSIKSGSLVGLRFIGLLRITDDICSDYNDSGNWLAIDTRSTITFEYNELPYSPQLSLLPYPFIDAQSLFPGQALLVVPAQVTGEQLIPALRVASSIAAQASFRGFDLGVTTTDTLSDEQKQNNHIIYVGTSDQFPVIQNNKIKTSAPDEGLLTMMSSPWNKDRALLAVTGENNSAVNKAAEMVLSRQNLRLAQGNTLVVTQNLIQNTIAPIDWQSVTFEKLGYADQAVLGGGANTLSYNIMLPNDKIPRELNLNIMMSHSSFNPSDHSTLNFAVNGVKQTSLILEKSNSTEFSWPLSIPGSALKPGKNVLDFIFDLHVNQEGCQHYDFLTWGVVFARTSLNFILMNSLPATKIDQFPIPFDNGTVIVIPDNVTPQTVPKLIKFFTKMGMLVGERIQNFDIVLDSKISLKELAQKNSILLGTPEQNKKTAELLNDLSLKLDQEIISLIEFTDSSWSRMHTSLVITGTDENNFISSLELLMDDGSRGELKGNIAYKTVSGAIVVKDTTIPLVTKKIDITTKQETQVISRKKYVYDLLTEYYQILLLVGFSVLSIILAIISYRVRNKKKDE